VALSKDKALNAAREILMGPRVAEAARLDRIAKAMAPCGEFDTPRVEIPKDAPAAMISLARKASTNFLPLVVDTFSQVMKVDGYYSSANGEPTDAAPWQHWQRNRMGARQTGIHRAALQYGASYTLSLPGIVNSQGADAQSAPVIRGISPRSMTALYRNPADDEWPEMALHIDGDQMLLYDADVRYRFGVENPLLRSGMGAAATTYLPIGGGGLLSYIDTEEHGVGVCPVTRFRDRMLLDGEEQYGIVEPLMRIQERIDETTFGMLVTQFFQAFKQRYIVGWVPESEQEFLKATAADVWTFDDENVKVGQLEAGSPGGYIESKASAIRDLSAIGQVPAQNLGVDGISNISDATLAGLETGKDRKADEITTSFGESWEQTLRLCAHIAGDAEAAADYSGEVRWKDSTARSFAQTVDGLGKLATMLGIPQELLWEDIPGWTQQKIDRAKALRAEADSLGALTSLLNEQSQGA
jgi:hypothetical protein